MAQPTTCGVADNNPCVVEVTGTAAVVELNPRRDYTLYHDGVQNDGPTANADLVSFDLATGTTANATKGDAKGNLPSGSARTIGPNVSAVALKTASANEVMVTIVPGPNYSERA